MSRATTSLQWLVLLMVGASPFWMWMLYVSADSYPLCNRRRPEEHSQNCRWALEESEFCHYWKTQGDCLLAKTGAKPGNGDWTGFTYCLEHIFIPDDDCYTEDEDCVPKYQCKWIFGLCMAEDPQLEDAEGNPEMIAAPRVQAARTCIPNYD